MIIANFNQMLDYGLDMEYEYKGHEWLNEKLSCGCITAICLDIKILQEERIFLFSNFNKVETLNTIIRETLKSTEEDIHQYTEKFMGELTETQSLLSQFIIDKRNEYNLPMGTDCNGEFYLLKLKKGSACSK